MTRSLTYEFHLEDGRVWRYELTFDAANRFVPKNESPAKEWTKLDFHKCPHCPLASATSPQCPVARNLDQIVEDSKSTLSCTKAKITVTTKERVYLRECATQEGLRSLFGVVMASSGCPHLDWFRPLARFHLPFADMDETLFRALSVQLVDDYMHGRQDMQASAERLRNRYLNVEKVNHAFVNRIRSYCNADADKNAMAALDVFVQMFPYQLQSNFESIRKLFPEDPA